MSRPGTKKVKKWSHRFELSPLDEDETRIHNFLDKLAEENQVSLWIRKTLLAALPSKPTGSRVVEKQLPRKRKIADDDLGGWSDDEPIYEDID